MIKIVTEVFWFLLLSAFAKLPLFEISQVIQDMGRTLLHRNFMRYF